ncbi:quinone-dependent dihydroorotate dehydrogenase [Alkalilimnicola ehrlichii]|uniref:quinone-dependent dihydroorotate dehydrogenase n=1 Tax=Alkalilimnicola ehrlichii TaxID=351052 RepID=UPI003BA2F390
MYSLIRPLLMRMDAERSHEFSLAWMDRLARLGLGRLLRGHRLPDMPRRVMGLTFANPVGLAAGLDKNGEHLEALGHVGFGFIEVGTVTPRPQPGNPEPRLFRLPAHEAIINRMGFNNQGVDALVQRLRVTRYQGVLGVNIGKNKDTPTERATDDYLSCLQKVYPYADYVAVNVSSPNTPGLRDLQGGELLETLLGRLTHLRGVLAREYGRYVPLVVKIAPDMDEAQRAHFCQQVLRYGIDGVAATNTTLSRDGVEDDPLAREQGGLSGAPLRPRAQAVLEELGQRLGHRVPLIGVGGIMSGADAQARMAAGADLLQIYSGFIYRGPLLLEELLKAVAPEH